MNKSGKGTERTDRHHISLHENERAIRERKSEIQNMRAEQREREIELRGNSHIEKTDDMMEGRNGSIVGER